MDKILQILDDVIHWLDNFRQRSCLLHIDRRYFIWFTIAFIIPVIVVFISLSIIPATSINTSKVTKIQHADTTGAKRHHVGKEERLEYSNTHLMRYNNAYLKARVEMLKSDSVNLLVNLTDSIIGLEIKGVIMLEARIGAYKICRGFRKKNQDNMLEMLSTPYLMESRIASIPLYPVVVKEAPRDTAEANQAPAEMHVPIDNDVYCTLFFNKDLVLFISQTEDNSGLNRKEKRKYFRQQRRAVFKDVTRSLFHFRRPAYQFWISISVPKADARSLYRALPEKAQMALQIRSGSR